MSIPEHDNWTVEQVRGVTDTYSPSTLTEPAYPPSEQGDIDNHVVYGEDAWVIPGKEGEPESCGVYYHKHFCNECGEVAFGASQCMNRGCPNCAWP